MSPTELKMQPTIHLEGQAGYARSQYPALRSKCIVGCIFIPSVSLSLMKSIYIKMNRRSLVSLKLKNGSTDLNIYFFILFALLQGWFKKKKNRKSCPENWKIREKLKVLFSVGTAGTIWQNFFFVRNNPYEVFM
jgi:hypothetical protein